MKHNETKDKALLTEGLYLCTEILTENSVNEYYNHIIN